MKFCKLLILVVHHFRCLITEILDVKEMTPIIQLSFPANLLPSYSGSCSGMVGGSVVTIVFVFLKLTLKLRLLLVNQHFVPSDAQKLMGSSSKALECIHPKSG